MSNKVQKNKKNYNKHLATLIALVLILSGTFAWQSFDQIAINETQAIVENAGVRLHDDFDGVNKDIYVENYTTLEESGDLVYGRIRLDEYLEIGMGAGSGQLLERNQQPNQQSIIITQALNTHDVMLTGSRAPC